MDLAGVPHWVARELPDITEVEVGVVTGQLTQAAHQLVRLGQVVVKSHAPVISVQRSHQAEVLLDSLEIFSKLMKPRGTVSVERESNHLLVRSSLESRAATGCFRELDRMVLVFLYIGQSSATVTVQQ